jgi:hypothetical protein
VSKYSTSCVSTSFLPPSLVQLFAVLLVHDIGEKSKSKMRSGSKWFQVVQKSEGLKRWASEIRAKSIRMGENAKDQENAGLEER